MSEFAFIDGGSRSAPGKQDAVEGFYVTSRSDAALYRVNTFKYARRNPVRDEKALDINMDQRGSTAEKTPIAHTHGAAAWAEKRRRGLKLQVVAPLFDVRTEIEHNYRARRGERLANRSLVLICNNSATLINYRVHLK